MANHADARFKAAIYTLNERMKMPEFKRKPSAALMKFLKFRDFLVSTEDLNSQLMSKRSDQDTMEIKLLNKQSISTGSARAYNHSGSKNDSRAKTVTFTTVTADFSYSVKEADRVVWNEVDMVAAKMWSAFIALHSTIETTMLAQLNTNKSQVIVPTTPVSGTWDATNHIFQILNGDYDVFLQKLKGFMREN